MLEVDTDITMSDTERPSTRRAELFVRASLPGPAMQCRTAVECRLQELQCAGVIDEWTTTVWRKRVPVTADCPERSLYEAFQSWAERVGASLEPCFDTRECYCTETGEKRTELVLPVRCLAVYEDETLARVAPITRAGRVESIDEYLDTLGDAETAASNTDRRLRAD